LDGTGHRDYLVCVYYNGFNDVLRVLRVQNGVGSVAADATVLPHIGGALGHVTLVDLDGDGKPEILLSIPGERSSEDWVLKWTQGRLSLMGPTRIDSRGRPHSLLSSVELLDVDGDGIPELLTRKVTDGAPVTYIYKFTGGKFARVPSLVFRQRLVRTKDSDNQQEGDHEQNGEHGDFNDFVADFNVNSPGSYVLRVINGDSSGEHHAEAVAIELNDTPVLSPKTFKKKDRVTTVPVTLTANNEIYIELHGDAGSEITVVVAQSQ
jgi:hypothetical protein